MAAVATAIIYDASKTTAEVKAELEALAPTTGDFVISYKQGSQVIVAKITP
jgi:hypothetical protein